MTDPQAAVETLARALAKALREGLAQQQPGEILGTTEARALWSEIAPQIRAEAMEEAARVADEHAGLSGGSAYDAGWKRGASCIAAAIRERARG